MYTRLFATAEIERVHTPIFIQNDILCGGGRLQATYVHVHVHTCMRTHTHAHTHTHSLAHTHSLTHSHTHTHVHSLKMPKRGEVEVND